MNDLTDQRLFLIVYLSNSQTCTNNLYIVANTKIDALNLFLSNLATKEIQITNIIDFGIINDCDLGQLTKELDKRANSPIWFDSI